METKGPVVTLLYGGLRGVIAKNINGGKYYAFRGIPYAEPPVGQLRFKDPKPAKPWYGIKDASNFGDYCAHLDATGMGQKVIGSDNCLYLNVYTTSLGTSIKRPVMFWIHGGAFLFGSGTDFIYGPDHIVRKDVVLVTINYRLGVLGFLNMEHESAAGNQGLKDQVMALKWVQKNIDIFGGDPNNVTIFGESAGGVSVHYLALSPLAKGLFHKAISQSGVVGNPWSHVVDPAKYGFQLAASLGKKSDDPKTVVDFLRTVDARDLVTAQMSLIPPKQRSVIMGAFGPTIDNKSPEPFFPQHPSVEAQKGVQMPYLLGYNENEGSFLLYLFHAGRINKLLKIINENFEQLVHPEVLKALKRKNLTADDLKRLYFNDEPASEKNLQKYSDFTGDMMFIQGIHNAVNIQAEKSNHPTYFYKFCYESSTPLMKAVYGIELEGATHADELPYLFMPRAYTNFGIDPPKPGSTDYKVIQYLTDMWVNFAKTGNPTPVKSNLISTIWEPLTKGNEYRYLRIDEHLRMESVKKGLQRFEWTKLKHKL